jgi:hypothetical protein
MPTKTPRFTKRALAAYVFRRLDHLYKTQRFDLTNGSKQVEGKGEPVNILYGEWEALNMLALEFDLEKPQ